MTRADFNLIERMLLLSIVWGRTVSGHKLDSPFALSASEKFREKMAELQEECEDGETVQ